MLRCRCLRNVSATSSGGSTFLACPQGCLSARCLPTFTFGQTPRTWGGVPISTVRSLPACGTRVRRRCPSTPGNCWPYSWFFASSSHLYKVARWLSSVTTPQQWRISAKRAARDLLSSTPWPKRSCVGQSLFPSDWLHNFFQAPTTSSRTPCLAPTSSHIQSGRST